MAYDDEEFEEPPHLKRLRLLVSILMVVLMVGILTIAVTIVIRLGFSAPAAPKAVLAEELRVPEGAQITAAGQGSGTVLLVVRMADGAETLLTYDAATGAELSRTPITRD